MISRIIQAPASLVILHGQPPVADDRQHDVAIAHHLFKMPSKIDAKRHGIDILEELIVTNLTEELVVNTSDDVRAVFAPVAEEDFGTALSDRLHGWLRRRLRLGWWRQWLLRFATKLDLP